MSAEQPRDELAELGFARGVPSEGFKLSLGAEPYRWGGADLDAMDPDCDSWMTALVNATLGPVHPVPHVVWWRWRRRKRVKRLHHIALNRPFDSPVYLERMTEAYAAAGLTELPQPITRRCW